MKKRTPARKSVAPRPKKKPQRRARRTRPESPAVVPPAPADVPYWLAGEAVWRELPPPIRAAAANLLAPAYRRLVLEAPGELERSVGVTLVHLIWLEVCGQLQMAQAVADPDGAWAIVRDPERLIAEHLELIGAKCQTAELLLKLRMVNAALERAGEPLPALPPPADASPQIVSLPATAPTVIDVE